jgi:hypothetical protein
LADAKRPRRFTGLGEKSLEGGQFASWFESVTGGTEVNPISALRLHMLPDNSRGLRIGRIES